MNPKVILFFGQHGGLPSRTENGDIVPADEDRDIIVTMKKIRKETKKIPSINKVLVAECVYFNMKRFYRETKWGKNDAKKIFDDLVKQYNIKRKKLLRGKNLDKSEYDFPSILLQFAKNEGYFDFILENPYFEITWRYMDEPQNQDAIQTERDELLVNQLHELILKYPDKTLIVVRGINHIRWMPNILERKGIPFKIVEIK